MEKILFYSVMSYWPAIEKLFNSGTYLLRKKLIYVPPARKLVFSLQLTVAQCSALRYKGK